MGVSSELKVLAVAASWGNTLCFQSWLLRHTKLANVGRFSFQPPLLLLTTTNIDYK